MITLVENKDIAINSISKDIMKQIEAMESYGLRQSEFSCFPEIVTSLGSYCEVYSYEISRDNLILVLSSEIAKNKMAYANIYYFSDNELHIEYFYQEEASYWNPSSFDRLCFQVLLY